MSFSSVTPCLPSVSSPSPQAASFFAHNHRDTPLKLVSAMKGSREKPKMSTIQFQHPFHIFHQTRIIATTVIARTNRRVVANLHVGAREKRRSKPKKNTVSSTK